MRAAALTVFYDGGCPLCRREIGHYRRQPGAGRINWVDVSETDHDPVAPGLDRETALGRFHVQLPDGRLAAGAAGFATLWSALPGWRVLGRIAAAPGIRVLAEFAYLAFLKIRPAVQWMARRLCHHRRRRELR